MSGQGTNVYTALSGQVATFRMGSTARGFVMATYRVETDDEYRDRVRRSIESVGGAS